ncbi:hypothetical protein [Tistrella mobilis]|uniref:Uncharacterized protein n=1 Tax=Tistrella mobilis (strain KA081020-065) TaxID=1110502 RepID=I3TTU0_TISMK|nr:hypothetical protein [Tistrella mobilis]AFK56178.1 hypothetical protein TMO_b0170 [Tistrella mobilis KA081020-065]
MSTQEDDFPMNRTSETKIPESHGVNRHTYSKSLRIPTEYSSHEDEYKDEYKRNLIRAYEDGKKSYMEDFEEINKLKEQLHQERRELRIEKAKFSKEKSDSEKSLENARRQTESERQKYNEEISNKLRERSSDYVKDTVDELRDREKMLVAWSKIWNFIGVLSLFVGIFCIYFVGEQMIRLINSVQDITANFMVLSALKSLLVIGISGTSSGYAFSLGGKHMHEALKIADRIHAIRFGGMYIQIYGSISKWEETKDAFSDWNVSAPTAFYNMQTEDGILQKLHIQSPSQTTANSKGATDRK